MTAVTGAGPTRGPALGARAMVASAHPLASLAGVEVLRAGGTSMDAGIAMAGMLAVVDPAMTGVGGDLALLYYAAAERRLVGLDGTGRAPREASVARYRKLGHTTMPLAGPLTVTVPGAVDGWVTALGRYGTRRLGELLAPAVDVAAAGFPVGRSLIQQWEEFGRRRLAGDADAQRMFTTGGRFPRPGERLALPDLARTLRRIGEEGAEVFYRGDLGRALVAAVRAKGGLLAEDDLLEHRSEWVEPLRRRFRGLDVAVLPPGFQGVALLHQLAILDGSALPDLRPETADAIHLQAEAARLAIAELDVMVTDARFSDPAWRRFLLPEHAAAQRERIVQWALRLAVRGAGTSAGAHTTAVIVVDAEGNVLVLLQSLRNPFGSGIVAGDTGVLLHNRGRDFTLDPAHINVIAPGKRTLHTLCPVMLLEQGAPRLAIATIGGHKQTFGTQQVLVNHLVFDMDLQAAVDAPRWALAEDNRTLHLEPALAAAVPALAARGHAVVLGGTTFGGSQAVAVDGADGVRVGASDTRYDGIALGF